MNSIRSLHAENFNHIFDLKLFEEKAHFEKLTNLFSKFDLSPYESYIYLFLSKNGKKTAPQIYKSLKIPRTETYRILTRLQGKGLVTSSFDHPMTYTSSPIKKALETLINQEKNRISDLEFQKEEVIDLFSKIPSVGSEISKDKGNQFQILQGPYQINNKIKEMIASAKSKFLLIGSENEFLQFHHGNIFEILKKSKLDLKILSPASIKANYFLKGIKKDHYKNISEKDGRNLCFAIKDEDEIVFFMKNEKHSKDEQIAIWSDSIPIVSSLNMLFNIIWYNYQDAKEAGKYIKLEKMQQEYRFQLKEIKQVNMALITLNKILSKS